MLYIRTKIRGKGYTRRKGIGHNNHKKVRVTKEAWESACLELLNNPSMIDWRSVKKISDGLGISQPTFEKYYNLWLANGKKTEELALIKKETPNDESGDKKASDGVQDLPKIQRSYKRTV